jgi:predicted short-subunit dehydrogenase-like oxidoreductase (DUF2520 family)
LSRYSFVIFLTTGSGIFFQGYFVYFIKNLTMEPLNISFAGAGRVANALCRRFSGSGHRILQIISPGEESGAELAAICNAQWSSEPIFDEENDLVIVAVPDKVLENFLGSMKCGDKTVVVHTAGSYGIDIFPSSIKRTGVFYPLQTFSKEREVDFYGIPLFIESAEAEVIKMLEYLAVEQGCKVCYSDLEHRQMLHLAAVFVCNFQNHLLTAGKEISEKAGFSLDILRPLISETFAKAKENGPEKSQTGPAIRNDFITIEKHLELLSFNPDLKRLYSEMSNSIIGYYKDKG